MVDLMKFLRIHTVPKYWYRIYSIINNFHILAFVDKFSLDKICLIRIRDNDKVDFEIFSGRVLYISKTGFIKRNFLEHFDMYTDSSDDIDQYSYYDISTDTWSSHFEVYTNYSRSSEYFIADLNWDTKKLTFYVFRELWFQDLQDRNTDFCVEKYYVMEDNIKVNCLLDCVDVHFKDVIKKISVKSLKELRSDFVNEQLLQTEIYLDSFTYEEYQNQTHKFLDYISSYKLHLYLKDIMWKELFSFMEDE